MNGQLYCENFESLVALNNDRELQVQIEVISQQVISIGGPNQIAQIEIQAQPAPAEENVKAQQNEVQEVVEQPED